MAACQPLRGPLAGLPNTRRCYLSVKMEYRAYARKSAME